MKKGLIKILGILFACLFSFILVANFNSALADPQPEITSIDPPGGQILGKSITIYGLDFSSDPKKNQVKFIQPITEPIRTLLATPGVKDIDQDGKPELGVSIPTNFELGSVGIQVIVDESISPVWTYNISWSPKREIHEVIPPSLPTRIGGFIVKGEKFLSGDKVQFPDFWMGPSCPTIYQSSQELEVNLENCPKVDLMEKWPEPGETDIKVIGDWTHRHSDPYTIKISNPLTLAIYSINPKEASPGTEGVTIKGINFIKTKLVDDKVEPAPEKNKVEFIKPGQVNPFASRKADQVDTEEGKWLKFTVPEVLQEDLGKARVQVRTATPLGWSAPSNALEFTISAPPVPTLFVALKVATDAANWREDILTGVAPLNEVDFKAKVTGIAEGPINYLFDCGWGTTHCLEVEGEWKPDGWCHFDDKVEEEFTKENLCDYPSPRTTTARVRVERGDAPAAENEVTIEVTEEAVLAPPPAPVCGNGVREGNEQCDGNDLAGQTCQDLGFTGGTLKCKGDCTFDTSGCTGPPPTYTLEGIITGTGSGTVNVKPDDTDHKTGFSKTYYSGSLIVLKATPDSGSVFTGWSGDCPWNVNPCTLTMDENKSVTALFNIPTPTLAPAAPPPAAPPGVFLGIRIENPLTAENFQQLVDRIINFIFTIAIVAAPLLVVVGAIYLLTSAGDPKKVDIGKKIILYAFIGLAIVFLAKGLYTMIESVLGIRGG